MEALRDLADDFNVRAAEADLRGDLDVTQAMAFKALKADVVPRPRALGKSAAEGPNDRTKYGLVVMDVFTREAAVETVQNKNAETVGRATRDGGPGHQARRAGADGGRRELCGHDRPGNKFATLDRELPEAVHRTKRPEDRNAVPPWWTGASRR